MAVVKGSQEADNKTIQPKLKHYVKRLTTKGCFSQKNMIGIFFQVFLER